MSKVQHDNEKPAVGQQVITAVACIHADIDGAVKIFLPKRADTKKFLPGVYELPGGHIDFGEDLVAGLKREIKEEFDMAVEVGDLVGAFTYTNEIKGSHSVELIYYAKFIDPIEHITLHPEDHSGYTWVAEHELELIYSDQKKKDDVEYTFVRKAFSVLKGARVETL